jgi:hypothetical protein
LPIEPILNNKNIDFIPGVAKRVHPDLSRIELAYAAASIATIASSLPGRNGHSTKSRASAPVLNKIGDIRRPVHIVVHGHDEKTAWSLDEALANTQEGKRLVYPLRALPILGERFMQYGVCSYIARY